MTEISVRLGHEWSKLSEEQRRPFNEVAHKLQYIHRQKISWIFYRYSNASSSTEEVKNYNTHLQTSETAPESLEQPDTVSTQQLSANNKLECKCEDSVDVLN
ncbi:sex-determining region Y protein-like [Epinephelus fuscoguttatus]|uniref:sex-determining region Y protein-like n=1 Tax=Epinephelus fuscoguttatus TaxID=293821 RepID=UPI0020D12A75|nr:sex-determining region Y protein-like [Epinephelus fuscoguttatus]